MLACEGGSPYRTVTYYHAFDFCDVATACHDEAFLFFLGSEQARTKPLSLLTVSFCRTKKTAVPRKFSLKGPFAYLSPSTDTQ